MFITLLVPAAFQNISQRDDDDDNNKGWGEGELMCRDPSVCQSHPMAPALFLSHSACTVMYMTGSSCSNAVKRTGTHQHSDGEDDPKHHSLLY